MKILHISQGLPPFRKGGLTTYCTDLMAEQQKQGHEVSILYPGHYESGKLRIKEIRGRQFSVYELINPLPLALTFGIGNPEIFTKECDSDVYRHFFAQRHFDVVHVHCTMGFHKECFQEIKRCKIPMVFTTHDYYLLCPRCTMVTRDGEICYGPDPEKCRLCNAGKGISERKNKLLQSAFYQHFKQSFLLSFLRDAARKKVHRNSNVAESSYSADKFRSLLCYNRDILRMMDLIHCNSPQTEDIYHSFEPNLNYITIPITHSGLPSKIALDDGNGCFRIVHLNGTSELKGYPQIIRAVEKLREYGVDDWSLDVYGSISMETKENPQIHIHGRFRPNELPSILRDADCVVCASKLYETFGFVVQEALAAGVPVVVSNHTGSRCLTETAPISLVYDADRDEALTERLVELKKNLSVVKAWAHALETIGIEKHTQEIEKLYNCLRKSFDDR